MAAYRCLNCDLNWPQPGECKACGNLTQMQFWAKVDKKEKLEQAVKAAGPAQEQKKLEEMQVLDKVQKWRYQALKNAGFHEVEALFLATNRNVDLHQAVDLAAKAGADMAYEILR